MLMFDRPGCPRAVAEKRVRHRPAQTRLMVRAARRDGPPADHHVRLARVAPRADRDRYPQPQAAHLRIRRTPQQRLGRRRRRSQPSRPRRRRPSSSRDVDPMAWLHRQEPAARRIPVIAQPAPLPAPTTKFTVAPRPKSPDFEIPPDFSPRAGDHPPWRFERRGQIRAPACLSAPIRPGLPTKTSVPPPAPSATITVRAAPSSSLTAETPGLLQVSACSVFRQFARTVAHHRSLGSVAETARAISRRNVGPGTAEASLPRTAARSPNRDTAARLPPPAYLVLAVLARQGVPVAELAS